VYFNGHGALGSSGAEGAGAVSCERTAPGSLRALLVALGWGIFLSAEVADMPAGMLATAALKSKAVPGVLGVLVAEPNEAKAPEPRPKAEEPPIVGEARALVVSGGMALKGLRPPCEDESPPKRLVVAEKVRAGGSCG
jgi:hypothetical protein